MVYGRISRGVWGTGRGARGFLVARQIALQTSGSRIGCAESPRRPPAARNQRAKSPRRPPRPDLDLQIPSETSAAGFRAPNFSADLCQPDLERQIYSHMLQIPP